MGRSAELRRISKRVDEIRRTGQGRSLAIRGRRQVGKSRLVQELCNRTGLPCCFHTAVKGASATEAVGLFHRTLRESTLLTETARNLLPAAAPAGG
ncbi:ATP-binding protein [Catenuloplanes japonicus]|uniref:ATP-binding protein n=1 Tax=Catenuloplanes japonicus TaxID=33876 RepID=UPI00052570A1|nr:ATP-binding protein [Catenuloplanes japonicus]